MRTFISICLLFITHFLRSQTTFISVADNENIPYGNLVEVSFILKNAEGEDFVSPDFSKDFFLLSGPNRGISTIIQNGKMQREMSFSYTLQPKKKGKISIPPARIRVNGKIVKSNTLHLNVLSKEKEQNSDSDFFIRAEISQNNVYIGQQVRLDYKIYTRKEIQNYSILQESDYGGFYASDIQRMDNMVQTKSLNGIMYYTKVLRSVALFPQQAGNQSISPLILQVGLLEEDPQRPSSLFFNGDVKYVNLETNVLKVNVKDLPRPLPANFNGAVGHFSISANIDKTEASTNETFYLNISIFGDGDTKRIKSPSLNLPSTFQLYDTKSEEEERGENEGKKFSQKSFTYTIQPLKEGDFTFQPSFTYFDPILNKFETKSLDPFSLKITKGLVNVEVQKETETPFVILSEKSFHSGSSLNTILWILGFSLPFIGLIIYLFLNYNKNRKKIKTPFEICLTHLNLAKQWGDNGNYEACYVELSLGLRNYLFLKFGIPKENISNEQLVLQFKALNLPDSLSESLESLLKRFELVLYAPSMGGQQWEFSYKELYELIHSLDLTTQKKS